jgi:hypothetical protein
MPAREVDVLLPAAWQTIDRQGNHILRKLVNSEAHPSWSRSPNLHDGDRRPGRGDPRFTQGGTSMAVSDDVVGDTEAFFGTPLVSYLAPALRVAGGVAR